MVNDMTYEITYTKNDEHGNNTPHIERFDGTQNELFQILKNKHNNNCCNISVMSLG